MWGDLSIANTIGPLAIQQTWANIVESSTGSISIAQESAQGRIVLVFQKLQSEQQDYCLQFASI